jgi:hypothetical protein
VRASFLLLLLTNILFMAWTVWIAPASGSLGTPAPASDPTSIRRVGEPPAGGRPAANGSTAARSSASATCVSIGPFIEAAALQRVLARLEDLGYTTRRRAGNEEVRVGQWVTVANLATPDDAGNALNALRTVGLTDAYVVAESGPGIVISVGVFSDPERAGDAASAIRRAGLDATISDRLRPADVTWLDIDRATNGGLPEAGDFADVAPRSGPTLEMRACPGAA